MRVQRVEISSFDTPDVRQQLNEVSELVQRAVNRIHQHWFLFHFQRETWKQIQNWHETKQEKDKPPKGLFDAFPGTLQNDIYHLLRKEFTELPSRMVTCLCQHYAKLLKTRKSARGSKHGWLAILGGWESLPSFTRPLPIPCDKTLSLLAFDETQKRWIVSAKAMRDNEDALISTVCNLYTAGRKMHSVRAKLQQIYDGHCAYKGISLVKDAKKNKWFAMIAYAEPEPEPMDPEKTIVVRPAKSNAFLIRNNGRTYPFGGSCVEVEAARKRCNRLRDSHKHSYRYAPSENRKGHGRKRAIQSWEKYGRAWRGFEKTWNQTFADRLAKHCERYQIGTVVLFTGDAKHLLGDWAWFQLRQCCEQRLARSGIACKNPEKMPRKKPKKTGARKVAKKINDGKDLRGQGVSV